MASKAFKSMTPSSNLDASENSPFSSSECDQLAKPKVTLPSKERHRKGNLEKGEETGESQEFGKTQRQESNTDCALQCKGTSSIKKSIPGTDNSTSLKMRRDSAKSDDAKRLCSQKKNSVPPCKSHSSSGKSLVSKPLLMQSSNLEVSPKPTDHHRYTELSSGQLTSVISLPIPTSNKLCLSLRPRSISARHRSLGVKPAFSQSPSVAVKELTLPTDDKHRWPKVGENSSSDCSSRTPMLAIKRNSGPLSGHRPTRKKIACPRRRLVISRDNDDLFTPEPVSYVVTSIHNQTKSGTEREVNSSPSSSTTGTLSTPKTQNSRLSLSSPVLDTKISSSSLPLPKVFLPIVRLERLELENYLPSKDIGLKNSEAVFSVGQSKEDMVQTDKWPTFSLTPQNLGTQKDFALEAEAAPSKGTTLSHCSPSTPPASQGGERDAKHVDPDDPLDVELGLDLTFDVDLDTTQNSCSSEDEQLLSLEEMMGRIAKPPVALEEGASSSHSKPCVPQQPESHTTKVGIYRNSLDQILKEMNSSKRSKEVEMKLLSACKEGLLVIAEAEESISTGQQEFLQRYSVVSSANRDVHPGEVVFNLENFGRLFNQHTLQLRQCNVSPLETAQKTLLWSSPAQLRLNINIGLFQEAYNLSSPCPPQVTRFLFKMMSVHTERLISEQMLEALFDIACKAACEIVKNQSQCFEVWVPTVADVVLVLMNMGVPFITLFPLENLQPPFTEGDLLEDIHISSESPSRHAELCHFPTHNCTNILKYLAYCTSLCPQAYSDYELLLLLTVVSKVGLEVELALQPSVDLNVLQWHVINNIRDWENMLPKICLALTDLTDDHHNMCQLVHLLPVNIRGKELRRHLGLCMISKLLDGSCTYRPNCKDFKLSDLGRYLPRMQPSTLLRGVLSSSRKSNKEQEEEDMVVLDEQSYYLCYSLLTLANEVSNFYFDSPHQKEQLLLLCSQLERYITSDIRESEKHLYRTKVKDLVARIHTKWQVLLQRTRPLHGKLYDYWQPPPGDMMTDRQRDEMEEGGDNDDDEATAEWQEVVTGDEEGEEREGTEVNDIAKEDDGGGEKEKIVDEEELEEALLTVQHLMEVEVVKGEQESGKLEVKLREEPAEREAEVDKETAQAVAWLEQEKEMEPAFQEWN
ncbi:SMC5-SMC6 complex localization factor protein 2 [Lampris incognitus]|uniref:SMC5-SMC6 complex localization factor protein 2 n=1 Tax=Lampris incognitus TaxID=2546036 RepID=UPI0024B50D4E|nr:SMC5-SMC6 complex localization factor protein 2 [Lampris incognitus]